MAFGDAIRTHRRRRGTTQEELARETGLSARTIRNLESGRIGRPRPSTVQLLADALGLAGADRDRFLRHAFESTAERADTVHRTGEPDRHPRPAPSQLPSDVAGFTGRGDQLRQLDALLDGDGAAMVITAIAGTAGIGKTALAVHWAHRVRDRFPDGQLYLNLRGYDPDQPVSASEALARFLIALGVSGQDVPLELEERAARFRSTVADRRMLIVLDNASSVEQVRPLLPGSASCAVLVTSRDRLAGLVAVHGARRLELDLLPRRDALALLRRLIGERIDAEPHAAATLADQCARLPLALRVAAELAVSRPASPLSELVTELDDLQRRLTLLDAEGDPRAAVASVFSWSLRHLPAGVAADFAPLGLHPGPDLDRYAAAALTDATGERAGRTLELLDRAHLIHPTGPGRYGMHDLLRGYATSLAYAPEADADPRKALTRLFDYYLASASAAMDALHPADAARRPRGLAAATPLPSLGDPETARAWLDAELPCLTAMAAYAAGHGWADHTIRLSVVLFRYLVGGHNLAALTIHDHAVAASRQEGDRSGEAEARIGLAVAYKEVGEIEPALEQAERSLVLFRETGDLVGGARALSMVGMVETRMERYDQATEHQHAALAVFRRLGDRLGEARALGNIALNKSRDGRVQSEVVVDTYRRALALFHEIGERGGEATVLLNLGFLEQRQGRLAAAADHNLRALAVFRDIGNRDGEAAALDNLGSVHHKLGRHRDATACYEQALTLFHAAGDRVGTAQALNGLGEAAYATGDLHAAADHHAAALQAATEAGDPLQQARACAGLGDVHRTSGDLAQARRHYRDALVHYTDRDTALADRVRDRLAMLED
ncbi:MAG: ATP-binding protein [Micromonosporaceae bacterium]